MYEGRGKRRKQQKSVSQAAFPSQSIFALGTSGRRKEGRREGGFMPYSKGAAAAAKNEGVVKPVIGE